MTLATRPSSVSSPFHAFLQHLHVLSHWANEGKNVEREALQVPIDPLAELVTNLEFRAALEVFPPANRDVVVPMNPNVGTLTTKVRDFTRMIPSEFHGSKVEEDTQEFIDEVYSVLMIKGVMTVEKARLEAYQLKGVSQVWLSRPESTP
uniref:Gag-pol polyprotein n=1 Tax=Solanum tuberosum TaxID=4113 RepID=M1DM08_SOLTU